MGHGWRRVTEAVRQKVSSDRNFRPTSNARNEAMFKEATDFAQLIKTLERDIRTTEKTVEGNFASLRCILESPLPRVYEEGQDGAVPADDQQPIGRGVATELVTEAAGMMRNRLEKEVIAPLKLWTQSYKAVQERMANLEKLRLEVDSRRRTVEGLSDKLVKVTSLYEHSKSMQRIDSAKHEVEWQKTQGLVAHKTDKFKTAKDGYEAMEKTLYNSLFTLLRDTAVLRDYTRTALAITQECYSMALSAYGQALGIEGPESTMQSGTALPGGNMPALPYATQQAPGDRLAPPPIKGMPQSPTANMYVASDDAGQAQAYDQSPRPAPYAMPQHHYSPRVGGYEPSGMSGQSGMNMYTGVMPQGAAAMYGQAVMHSPSHGHGPLQHQGVMHSPGRMYQAAPHAMQPQGGQGWTAAGM